jgi:hypothetical protein
MLFAVCSFFTKIGHFSCADYRSTFISLEIGFVPDTILLLGPHFLR